MFLICKEIYNSFIKNIKNNNSKKDSNNNWSFWGFSTAFLLYGFLLYLLTKIKKLIKNNYKFMSRINKKVKLKIIEGAKIEIGFIYREKKQGQKIFNICYRIEKITVSSKNETEIEIGGNVMAKLFQKNILERFLLRFQTAKTFYSAISIRLQNEYEEIQTYKHFLTPYLYGKVEEISTNIQGTYSCKCICASGKSFSFKLYNISIPPAENTADIFINDLIPPEALTLKLMVEEDGIQYGFELTFAGKKLISNIDEVPSLVELIE